MSPIEKRLDGKSVKITLYIQESTADSLRVFCAMQKTTLGYVADHAILEYIKRQENE